MFNNKLGLSVNLLFYDIYIFVELLVLLKYYFLDVIELFTCVLL